MQYDIFKSAGDVEYTDSTFAEEHDFPNECLRYDTKQSDDTIYPTPPLGQDMTQGQFLSGV